MSLYHLDPRQAGTAAAPDAWNGTGVSVNDVETRGAWYWSRFNPLQDQGPYPTESAALTAARQAAGFGHVAERACDRGTDWEAFGQPAGLPRYDDDECACCAWHRSAHRSPPCGEFQVIIRENRLNDECGECAWPRDAHRS